MIDRDDRRRRGAAGISITALVIGIAVVLIAVVVVVFAVSGSSNKGQSAAVNADAAAVKAAEKTYHDKHGVYATLAQLKTAGLVASAPTLNVALTSTTPAGASGPVGSGYAIACADSQPCSELTVGFTSDVYVLTGNKAALGAYPLNANIFETLIGLSSTYTLQPSLALSWELIPASMSRTTAAGMALPSPYPGVDTWRFHLRPSVKFQNGAPMNATAVKVGLFDRILGGAAAGGNIKAGGPANTSPAAQAESAQVVDDTCTSTTNCTIDFTPSVENLRVPQQIVHPQYAVEAPGTVAGTTAGGGFQAVGTGPFSFVSYLPSSSLVVTRNPTYWGTPALLKGITFKFFPDATVRRQALQAGTVDVIYDVPRTDVALLQSSSFTVAKSQVGTYDAMYLNAAPAAAYTEGSGCEKNTGDNGCHDILKDLNVRKAVNYAIDRQALVNGPLAGQATTDQTFVAPLALAPYQSTIKGFSFSLSMANSLLDASGWTGPKLSDGTRTKADPAYPGGSRPLEVTIVSGFPDFESNDPMPEYIQGVLKNVGIKVDIVKTDAAYTTRQQSGQGDMWVEQGNQNDANPAFITFVLYTGPGFASTSAYPPRFAPANATPPFGTFNTDTQMTFTDPNLDSVRRETANAFADAIDNAAVLAPLAGLYRIYGMTNKVQGFVAHPAFLHLQWGGVSRDG